ncbi:MAG: orotate phosphoribosyltransferase, partial [Chloroflexota bacterium]
ALKHGLRADGTGLIFPVSRGISQAKDRRQAAMELNEQINAVRSKSLAGNKQNAMEFSKLAEDLYQAGCVKFGEFTLKSGLKSPIYIDLRQLASHPQLLFQVASAYRSILENLTFDRLVAIPYAAMPICTATSLQGNWPMIYPRKEAKDYGTKAVIEGEHQRGEQVAVVDDLTTTGSSKFEVIEKLTAAGLQVKDIIVLIDRESGAAETLRKAGLQLHAVFTLSQLAKILLEKEFINPEQQIAVEKFINASNAG